MFSHSAKFMVLIYAGLNSRRCELTGHSWRVNLLCTARETFIVVLFLLFNEGFTFTNYFGMSRFYINYVILITSVS